MTSDTRVQNTPGPWVLCRDNGARDDDPICIHSPGRGGVAEVWQAIKPNSDRAEEMANAHLIASAPDLLAALEALTQLGTDDNGAIIVGPRGWELAQAAIRRARGED